MPGFLMHTGVIMQCMHQGPAQLTATQPRVFVNGLPVALLADPITVKGCIFTIPGPKPQPCVLVKWMMPSTRVTINGSPAMVLPTPGMGPGVCQSAEQIPQGAPVITFVQTRVFVM
jgi:hypothetical protein